MQFGLGYHYYREHDSTKVICVFYKGDLGEGERYYYFDVGEKSIRSFSADNEVFMSRTKPVEDVDAAKVYDMQMCGLVDEYEAQKRTLVPALRHWLDCERLKGL